MSGFGAGWIEGAGGTARLRAGMMRILQEVGIDFRDDEVIVYWKAARTDVDGYRGCIARAPLMELVAKAPERFTFTARNPERSGVAPREGDARDP